MSGLCFFRATALGSKPIIIGDNVRYTPEELLLPKQYEKYVESIIIPNGMIMDRVEKMVRILPLSFFPFAPGPGVELIDK